jgi:hypothetical protein
VSDLKAYILCRFAEDSGVYSSWMDQATFPSAIVEDYLPNWRIPDDAGVLITHMHYRWEELHALRKWHTQNRIPILVLADGILEYRNTWEHPGLVDGSIFQPLFGHKLACIGRGQARTVESWGNVGRCEVVGLPRLDSIDRDRIPPTKSEGPLRILVATATTPAFDQNQRQTVVESLQQLKTWALANQSVNGRPIELIWRLSDGLESQIGVGDDLDLESRTPLGEVIESVDATICTPSTLYLESVIRRRPTALLDFHGSPQYVTSAWTISAAQHLDFVIPELAAPPQAKMLFQESVLLDQLECRTPAAPRMLALAEQMMAAGQQAKLDHATIELPDRILTDLQQGFSIVPKEFDLRTLYANNESFDHQDQHRLQIELDAAIKRLGQLPPELVEKSQYIGKLNRTLDRSRVRVEDMHNRVVAIRKRFGVEPAKPEMDGRDISDDAN